MAHEELLAQLDLRREKASAMGGPEKLAKRAERGELNAMERPDALVDPGTVIDTGLSDASGVVKEDEAKTAPAGNVGGGYVVAFRCDEAGNWGVEVGGERNGEEFDPLRVRFTVLEEGAVPAIGEPAPRSQQLTLSDVADISEIDTSNPPRPELHDLTVAEAPDPGNPIVVAVAPPAFCPSRPSGPGVTERRVPPSEPAGQPLHLLHLHQL